MKSAELMQKICRSLSLSPVAEIMEDRVPLGELQRDEAPLENNKKKLRWVGVVSARTGATSKESAWRVQKESTLDGFSTQGIVNDCCV